ncbi:GNAT family N-acetyltransferase [Streptomyces sp. NPDC046853]|uniref:GNAT family N-acetyltransferase n=1 Tax=Streptomyces sp. NPDC046853 TaxID=3154920 RepID=UPI0033C8B004
MQKGQLMGSGRSTEVFALDDDWGYATNFYVTPSQRDQGTGSALLKALKQYARSAGFNTLIVWPSERSSPLWQRSGFQPAEVLELPLDT